MQITTIPQLVDLVNSHEWKATGERPSHFGLLRDFEADDGSLVIMLEGAFQKTAIAWAGPSICPFHEISLEPHQYDEILTALETNSRACKTKGTKLSRRTTIVDISDKGSLTSTIVTVNGKTFAVETLNSNTGKGHHRWYHRTIGTGLFHEWSQSRTGTKEECNRSHKEYLESMETIILRVAQ